MGNFSIWHWIVLAMYIAIVGVPLWKIAKKAGFSGWWSLLAHIPVFNIGALWLFATVKWPQAAR